MTHTYIIHVMDIYLHMHTQVLLHALQCVHIANNYFAVSVCSIYSWQSPI